jgi:hypothetical protein
MRFLEKEDAILFAEKQGIILIGETSYYMSQRERMGLHRSGRSTSCFQKEILCRQLQVCSRGFTHCPDKIIIDRQVSQIGVLIIKVVPMEHNHITLFVRISSAGFMVYT